MNENLLEEAKTALHMAYNSSGERERFFALLHAVELLLTLVEDSERPYPAVSWGRPEHVDIVDPYQESLPLSYAR